MYLRDGEYRESLSIVQTKQSEYDIYRQIELIDQDMENALEYKTRQYNKGANAFERMGMVGRSLFNLMLLDQISYGEFLKILEILGLSDTKGVSRTNISRYMKKVKNGIVDDTHPRDYPFMPVFWMVGVSDHKGVILAEQARLAKIEKELKQDRANVDKDEITKIKPIRAMHEMAIELKYYARKYKEYRSIDGTITSPQIYLNAVKLYKDFLVEILNYDDEGSNLDPNLVMQKFDELGDFIEVLQEKFPELPIEDMYMEYLDRLDNEIEQA